MKQKDPSSNLIAGVLVKSDQQLTELYLKLQGLLQRNFEVLSIQDKLLTLFEFSQKRILQSWLVQDAQISSFLANLDPQSLLKRNQQNFVIFGRLLCNPVVIRSLPHGSIDKQQKSYVATLEEMVQKMPETK